jgi:Ca-activated chloride channel family protein
MRFAQPIWLVAGAAAVVLLLVLRARSEILTTRAIHDLSGAHLLNARTLPSRFRRWLRVGVVCFAVSMGFVALARPQKGMRWETMDRKGTDLLLVVDTSKSMNADDVSPTRLERTKLAVRDLVERFPGDKIGLVAFAGDAFLESPMTLDHDALLETLASVDTSIISHPGTDIGRAIDTASAALRSESSNDKIMVLLTDGEDLEGKGLEAAKRAADAGITIDTVGVGTPAGELVPATNDQGVTVGFVRDENGTPVRSRLDEAGLRAIAEATHGTYRSLGADGRGLDRLYTESLAPLARIEHGAQVRRVYAEWFAIPLALSLFGLVLDSLLGFRPGSRARRARSAETRRVGRSPALGAAAALALIALVPARASASPQSAEKAYAAGHFDDAAKQYETERAKHPKDARLAIDESAAAYRAGHFDRAETALTQALSLSDPKLQQRVFYDLGDARYRLGATTQKDAPTKTIERWKAAIAAYDGALSLAPKDADARFNRDFVKKKLAELEEQQKQQQQKQQQKNQGGADKDQKDSSQGGNGQQGKDSNRNPKDQKGNGSNQDGKDQKGNDQKTGQKTGQTPPQTPNGTNPGASSKEDQSKFGAAGERISPDDARKLLDSLRGEERQVRFGNAKEPHTDDASQKDW